MSAHQGNSACRITVSSSDADVLREEAKKVLMFNHDPFEDFLDYVPVKQLELADIYRDATAVIDALAGGDGSGAADARRLWPAALSHAIHQRR